MGAAIGVDSIGTATGAMMVVGGSERGCSKGCEIGGGVWSTGTAETGGGMTVIGGE